MLPAKRFSAVFTALLAIAALAALAMHSTAKGAKPGGTLNRPISVEWRRDVWQPPEIRLMTESGGSMSTVNSDADLSRGGWPRWSPDGLAIGGYYKVLLNAAGDYLDVGLMVMAADGTSQRAAITRNTFNAWNLARPSIVSSSFATAETYACWLGNNALIFAGYSSYSDGTAGWRLFMVDANGVIVPLTETPLQDAPWYDDFSPHYSAALNKVVFVSDRTGFDELWGITPTATGGIGLQQITNFQGGAGTFKMYGPVWNPAGTRIVVATDQGASPHEHDLWILDVNLDQPNPVTGIDVFKAQGSGISEEMAAWSPTGDRLVFVRWSRPARSYKFEVVVADATTGAETIIVESTKQGVFYPDWKQVP